MANTDKPNKPNIVRRERPTQLAKAYKLIAAEKGARPAIFPDFSRGFIEAHEKAAKVLDYDSVVDALEKYLHELMFQNLRTRTIKTQGKK